MCSKSSLSKTSRILSVLFILIATVGFGLQIRHYNNKISDVDAAMNVTRDQFDKIIKSFDRFSTNEIKSLINQVHTDVIVGGQQAQNTDEAIEATIANARSGLALALVTWASSASNDFRKEIEDKVKNLSVQEMQPFKIEIAKRVQSNLDEIKIENGRLLKERKKLQDQRDGNYSLFLWLQLFGILLGAISEVVKTD